MGVLIKAVTDGFRRGGIAHRAKGTWYEDGQLSEEQLDAFRKERQLVVIEQAEQFSSADQNGSLLREMGETIASLEHALDIANDQYDAASVLLSVLREQQLAAPAQIVAEARALEPADPTAEGVICIAGDALLSLISQHLKPVQVSPEAPNDESDTTLDNSSGAEASQSPSQAAPGTSPSGTDSGAVATDKQDADKPAGRSKRGSGKGADK
ncbi:MULTISPECIES: HI1506-related protein [unclassified Pseudomonas]|uniref:HI1506-related protein n=1 Tax=unclassified Pseudomonas TaxID=196821 RepID=UPI0011A99CB3|nr:MULTISPECIES: HI1506-related protein [unclassified Pseudomonas]TWC21103.1 hypothetical protein FBY00_103115 [Pseudomonas sp. SJZ075]TWC36583.1 hypothetical protein FBY02_103115 [Pseudomonas sp. SJZ078]TWC57342.1 hypothetical protein FBY11_103115 [Pseudomonas sp. SJZ124]TWC92361.1 hypothetical protein FBY09_103169 [Pseudomonas sp. SJZ101]